MQIMKTKLDDGERKREACEIRKRRKKMMKKRDHTETGGMFFFLKNDVNSYHSSL